MEKEAERGGWMEEEGEGEGKGWRRREKEKKEDGERGE